MPLDINEKLNRRLEMAIVACSTSTFVGQEFRLERSFGSKVSSTRLFGALSFGE